VYVTDLIRVHEAGVTHHVAAVRQVNRQHRAAPELDVGRAVTMDVRVFRRAKIAPVEQRLDAPQKFGTGRHHVNELAVLRARLTHDDAPVLLDDLRFDFARMLVHQSL
jgi:hypothetical protein